jgi:hypothetical protein
MNPTPNAFDLFLAEILLDMVLKGDNSKDKK